MAGIGTTGEASTEGQAGTLARGRAARNLKKILVPTDFSAAAQQSFECAVSLARESQATITLLHVVDIACSCDLGPAQEHMLTLWKTAATKMDQASGSFNGAVAVQTLLTEGLPWEEIVHHSQDFDLLVMARSSTKKQSRCFSQHTCQRVLKNTHCSVLTLAGEQEAQETSWRTPALGLETSARG